MSRKMKVGILTWHYFLNFGSALQAYALKTIIEKCGFAVRIINYRDPKHGNPSYYKDSLRVIISKLFSEKHGYLMGRQITYPFLRFHADQLKLTQPSTSLQWLKRQVKRYDYIICGSDQIWAPSVLNPIYLLGCVPDNIKKVSYAASIGLSDIPEEMAELYKNALSRFSSISVREEKGKTLLMENVGLKPRLYWILL